MPYAKVEDDDLSAEESKTLEVVEGILHDDSADETMTIPGLIARGRQLRHELKFSTVAGLVRKGYLLSAKGGKYVTLA